MHDVIEIRQRIRRERKCPISKNALTAKAKKQVQPSDLTAAEGKILRYLCTFTPSHKLPVVTPKICVAPKWPFPTDLPRSQMDAKTILESLSQFGLAQPSNGGYEATEAGRKLIAKANNAGMWMTAKSGL